MKPTLTLTDAEHANRPPADDEPVGADDRGRVPRWYGAMAALLAAFAALATAELLGGIIERSTSPVLAVGEFVIDHVPPGVKDFAIRTMGTNDKPALVGGTLLLLIVFAIVIGVLSVRRLWIGIAGIAVFGLAGIGASVTRPSATASAAIPTLIGTLVAIAVLVLLLRRAGRSADAEGTAPPGFDRRNFLLSAAAVGGATVAIGGVGRLLQRRFDVSAARSAVQLPAPSSTATPLPTGVEVGAGGLTPFRTSNADFYRVDTALVTPQVAPETWNLKIHGMVDRELSFSYEDLVNRDLVERDITLVCVSNEVGGVYAGNARWLGVPLKDLLEEAGVQAGADQLVSRSVDGWTAGTPTAAVMDGRDALVAIGMNGEPLPVEHGFPARLVTPGLYGYTSATKWLTELELTTFGAYDAYWVQRGWAKQAPIKTLTRIDTPKGLSNTPAGKVAVGGVAWAIHRGIDKVEVKIDDGPWQPAKLGEVANNDTWRQWVYEWDATPGSHNISARATDSTGKLQTEDRTPPIPDGASGWHSIVALIQ